MKLPFASVLEAGFKVLDRVLPDPQQKAAAQLELMKLQQAGEFKEIEADVQLALAQIDLNKQEATTDVFRGGWRPFVGWTCGGGLFYQIIFRPIFGWICANAFAWTAPPSLEMDTLLTLLFSMLGLGAMRTTERVKGKV